ncbi:hypothetical protein BDC45DRAFT_569607 [Circinella umbellata]|nr:hypothetical protein BDC45DRAFT_569607 [Circinella umbellata]
MSNLKFKMKKTMLNVISRITTSNILGQPNNAPLPYSISLSSSKASSSKTSSKSSSSTLNAAKKQYTSSTSVSL